MPLASPAYVTVSEASRWLADNGFAPYSRHSIEIAVARRKLRARPALTARGIAVKVEDLAAYARMHCRAAESAGNAA